MVSPRAEEELVSRYSSHAPGSPWFALTLDEHMTVLAIDAGTSHELGLDDDLLLNEDFTKLVHADDHDQALNHWITVLSSEGVSITKRFRCLSPDGQYRWYDVTHTNAFETDGVVHTVCAAAPRELAVFRDLKDAEELLERLTVSLPTGIGHFSVDGTRLFANDRLRTVSGIDADHMDDYLNVVAEAHRSRLMDCVRQIRRDGLDRELELTVEEPDKAPRRCRVNLRLVGAAKSGTEGVLLFIEDITESWQLHERLSEQATIDPLTEVANRNAVIEALDEALHTRNRRSTAVVFFDVNGFKKINDHYGHAAGDALLRDISERLESVAREHDVVGRLGGDEFVVVCPDIDHQKVPSVADRFAEAVNGRRTIAGIDMRVATSCGFAVSTPGVPMAAEALIANADLAMYDQKRKGRSRPGAYDPELFVQHRTEMDLQERFVQALRDRELEVRLAPIERTDSGATVAYELLPHWMDGDELLGPDRLLPMAQHRGVLDDLSRWLLGDLKEKYAEYPAANFNLRITRAELQDRSWAIRVIRDLLQNELDPTRLSFHVRQDEMVGATDAIWSALTAARECGLRILLSDFDAGTSGLDIITERDVDGVIIGRRLLDHLRRGPTRRLLAASVMMCKELGLEVSACDVLSANDFAAMQSLGITLVQGPFLAAGRRGAATESLNTMARTDLQHVDSVESR